MNIALLHIDMQYIHVHPDFTVSGRGETGEARRYTRSRMEEVVVPAIQRLLEAFREAGQPVIHIVFNHTAPDGSDLDPGIYAAFRHEFERVEHWPIRTRQDPLSAILIEVRPEPGEIILEKTTYSAFQSTNLEKVLINHGIETLVFCGGLTSCCVCHTAQDAAAKGYRGIVVPDACLDRSAVSHDAGLDLGEYKERLTVDEVVERLS